MIGVEEASGHTNEESIEMILRSLRCLDVQMLHFSEGF